ncbi:hypothetical protein N7456_007653 [Penicillium angulare]|uniref:Protein kinase domain-containing protein n=1 Tax=Penicillium angulare TaxID=116970 RepID=A0A9W9K9G7_9EURO|nr:hypothetical protein N7456_007653 [Penicillium angulare]
MIRFAAFCWSLIYSSVYRATFYSIEWYRRTVFKKFKGDQLVDMKKDPAQLVQNSIYISGLADKMLTVQHQTGLEIVGVGAAGQPPSNKATPRALWDYASETVFHFGILKDERAILKLLADHPHPNIIDVIDVTQPEGIYLRKYRQLSELTSTSQIDRILWYQDVLRALAHLHGLGVAHSDIRKDNILFDSGGQALLSDFGASCPFGYPNPSLPVLSNGHSETVSDATDMFAMASMIYELECKVRPEISINSANNLCFPAIQTGNNDLDSLIENAWKSNFDSTLDMLRHAERLSFSEGNREPTCHPESKKELHERVLSWRSERINKYGCVVFSLQTESQIHTLAERYGWQPEEERRFSS